MGIGSVAVVLLVVGLFVGAGVTFVAIPTRDSTTTQTYTAAYTDTTTVFAPTATTSAVLTLIEVPVIHTQVETTTEQVTGVETLTYALTETSVTTASNLIGTIPNQTLPASESTQPMAFYIPAGTLYVSINSSTEVNFNIMNSALFVQLQKGQSVPMCSSTSCNLDQDGAKVGVASGSLYFQVTTPGTYYTWLDNSHAGTWVNGSLGTAIQQTTTYEVTSTSLSTTTGTNEVTITVTNVTYSTSTVG